MANDIDKHALRTLFTNPSILGVIEALKKELTKKAVSKDIEESVRTETLHSLWALTSLERRAMSIANTPEDKG